MSKERWLKTAACAALALTMIWAGCGGDPEADEGSIIMQAEAEKKALEALRKAAPDKWRAFGEAGRALLGAAPDKWKAFTVAKQALRAAAPEEWVAFQKVQANADERNAIAVETAVTLAISKGEAAYENALAELKTKAPDEWERYVSSQASYERVRTGYQNAQTMLETHENADESQKAKPHEKAWEGLKAAAPNELAAYEEAKRALERWQRIASQVAR